jgi:Cu-Zn family superoxide dismutase
VVHSQVDDLGRGNFPDSKTNGHSGSRVACGVIGLVELREKEDLTA